MGSSGGGTTIMTRDLRTYYSQRRSVCSRPFINSLQARRKHFLSGTATGEGNVGSGHPSARSAEKFFPLHFSVVWIGSRSTKAVQSYGAGGQLPPRKTGYRV